MALRIEDLLHTMNLLPSDSELIVNGVFNLAVLDSTGEYVGWIDMKTGKYEALTEEPEEKPQ